MMDNHKRFAKISNFSVNILTMESYGSHLSDEGKKRLE